jgi:hypothetical protein
MLFRSRSTVTIQFSLVKMVVLMWRYQMRYSQDHKAQTHQRIIKEASARFRK